MQAQQLAARRGAYKNASPAGNNAEILRSISLRSSPARSLTHGFLQSGQIDSPSFGTAEALEARKVLMPPEQKWLKVEVRFGLPPKKNQIKALPGLLLTRFALSSHPFRIFHVPAVSNSAASARDKSDPVYCSHAAGAPHRSQGRARRRGGARSVDARHEPRALKLQGRDR